MLRLEQGKLSHTYLITDEPYVLIKLSELLSPGCDYNFEEI